MDPGEATRDLDLSDAYPPELRTRHIRYNGSTNVGGTQTSFPLDGNPHERHVMELDCSEIRD
jgi:hypothetical protein